MTIRINTIFIRTARCVGISFWDAMMVRSAVEIGCTLIYSEDLNHGQVYDGARVENPFIAVE